jgi:hypothetical protein
MVPVPGVPELPAGLTVTGALTEFALVAVIAPEVGEVTGDVVTGNETDVEPCGAVTVAGTVTLGLVLDRPTETPPEPAGLARVTVPVAG